MRPNLENTSESLLREVRRWRLIAGALTLVILVLGGFSAYLLRSLDADYSNLLDDSLPVLNELRLLGNGALSTQRSMLNGLLADDKSTRSDALARAERFLKGGDQLCRNLGRRAVFADHATAYEMLMKAGEAYAAAAREVLVELKAGRMSVADALRQNRARPALDRFLEQIDISARYVESHSRSVNDTYSDSARSRSTIMVAVASLPLLMGVFVLLVVAGLLVVMILMFRRLGADDAR